MNILHILNNSYKPDPRVVKELQSLTQGLKLKVTLLCVEGEGVLSTNDNLEILRLLPKNINQYHKINLKTIINQLLKTIDFNKYQVIHAHDQAALHIAGLIKKQHPSLYLIYDAHEYIKGWKLYQRDKNLWKRLKGYVIHQKFVNDEEKDIKNNVDHIITVSNGLKELYSHFNIETTLIRNAPASEHSTESEIDIRSNLGLNASDTLIVHSGWPYYSDKMLTDLFKTVEKLPLNFKLCIICSVEGWNRLLKRYNITHLVGTRLFHHEFVPYNKLGSFLSSADIGLILTYNPKWSSFWFSMPNKLFDYSNAGLAIVTTDQPEFKNFIEENENGISFNPKEEKALEYTIIECTNNLERFKRNSEINKDNNDWKKEELKLITLYKKLVF